MEEIATTGAAPAASHSRRPAPVFVGFMGAGKSTAAAAAARDLGLAHLDSDDALEKRAGHSIPELFEREGEEGFRRREEEVVLELLTRDDEVISLGGGAVESARVREALAGRLCVWCQVDEELAWRRSQGTDRPLAADRDGFARRHREREPLYRSVARAILPAGDPGMVTRALPWIQALSATPGARLIWATSASAEYPAVIGPGSLDLLPSDRRWFAVADPNALGPHSGLLAPVESTIEAPGGESRKTLAEVERILRELAKAGARRDDGLLAFGGGVVGDMAGFCAAVYQRGIPVVQAPTTLVGQVDSAYGGKTGVDLPEGKNYAGAYHMPLAVLADTRTLASLPREELAAGFAEVVKTALIAGGELWETVRGLARLDPGGLDEAIFGCARTKLEIVAADERDEGHRAVLNLGHTVGHAIEAATGYSRYRHGEAIGLGLLAALRLSGTDDLRQEVEYLLTRHGLPARMDPAADVEAILRALGRDKKRTREGLGFVLVESPGDVREGRDVEPDSVRAAVVELLDGKTAA